MFTPSPDSANARPPIHIVGLYKCGTTWLLRALAAHPEVIAWREFDPIRAAYSADRRAIRLPALVRDWCRRRPGQDDWSQRLERLLPRPPEAVFRETFLGRGWLPVMGAQAQAAAARLADQDPGTLLEEVLAITGITLRRDDTPALDPARVNAPIGARAFRRGDLLALMEAVRDADPSSVPALFYRALDRQVAPGTYRLCKAADQLMTLQALRTGDPGARLVAIIRDGRDAAVSAGHFEQLMRQQQAPWRVAHSSVLKSVMSWSLRAAKVSAHVGRGELLVLRYEDLRGDFTGTMTALLHALGLSADKLTVSAMDQASSFQRASGGRIPGESAAHIVRRGMVGEWREALTRFEAAAAWQLAQRELRAFGYGKNGELYDSPLVLAPHRA
jgi:hypothetical protein